MVFLLEGNAEAATEGPSSWHSDKGATRLAPLTPEPWRGNVTAAVGLIDDLTAEISACERDLRRLGADHPYIPLLRTVPGIGWVLAYTIAAELGDIHRFPTPKKLVGYTGLCPRVCQSGEHDRRGSITKNGPKSLRWALIEAVVHVAKHPRYRERYQRTRTPPGPQPRRQGRAHRTRPRPRSQHLAHAHPRRGLHPAQAAKPHELRNHRSGSSRVSPGRPTTPQPRWTPERSHRPDRRP